MRVKTYPTLVFSQTVHASTHMLESLSWTNQIIQELLFGLIDETYKLFRVQCGYTKSEHQQQFTTVALDTQNKT